MLVFCIVGLDLGSNANLTNFKAKIYPPVLCFWHLYYGVYFMEYGKDSSLISSKKLGFPLWFNQRQRYRGCLSLSDKSYPHPVPMELNLRPSRSYLMLSYWGVPLGTSD